MELELILELTESEVNCSSESGQNIKVENYSFHLGNQDYHISTTAELIKRNKLN